ncbi:hypothetical protein HJG60_011045 [Phyllostomus discolor]|uniref:Uncharacterized protein n=1 Tax=Phyllostomus discolor TaxID=89673 RepID=A0A834ACG0_9CHIR|nr:hypothetical protein HJG60_011045 [Phyllostomus discolor]
MPFVKRPPSPSPCPKGTAPPPSPWPPSFLSVVGLLGPQVKGGGGEALVSRSPARPGAAPHQHDPHRSPASWLPSCRSAPRGPRGAEEFAQRPPGTRAQGSRPTPPACQAPPLHMAFSTSERSLLLKTGLSWPLRPCNDGPVQLPAGSSPLPGAGAQARLGEEQGGHCLGILGNFGHTPVCYLPANKCASVLHAGSLKH